MAIQEVVTLNEFGFQRRTRTTSSGTKSRYTVEYQSEPLVHVYNPKAMGEAPAAAIADHLRVRVQGITAMASPSTQRKRIQAEAALERGARWATKRYAGGRMGMMKPDEAEGRQGGLFNDSGRFAKSIVARATGESWVVNIAANRLDPSTFRDGEAGVMRMLDVLRRYVPEWGEAAALARVPIVKQEMALAADMILVNRVGRAWTRNRALRAELRRGAIAALIKGARLL